MTKRLVSMAMGLACVCLAWSASVSMAASPEKDVRPVWDKLLKAVELNDYDNFVAEGTDAFKTGITKQIFENVSNQASPRLKKGCTYLFLGELKQQGCQVYLWKLVFKDGGDDGFAKLAIKDGKVAGLLLQ